MKKLSKARIIEKSVFDGTNDSLDTGLTVKITKSEFMKEVDKALDDFYRYYPQRTNWKFSKSLSRRRRKEKRARFIRLYKQAVDSYKGYVLREILPQNLPNIKIKVVDDELPVVEGQFQEALPITKNRPY